MKQFLFVLSCLFFYNFTLTAQENRPGFQFHCKLIDTATGKPVSYAHIFNESKRSGKISDSTGYFQMRVSVGDTLVFMALGYLGKVYFVKNADIERLVTIPLEVHIYDIEAINFEVPRTYKSFQKRMLEVEPKAGEPMPELPDYNPYIRPQLLDTNIIYSGSFRFWHPVSGIYYKNNKREKSLRKVRDLEEQALRQPAVDAKYNEKLLTEITGFTGDTLRNFMLYCSFSFNFLYFSSQLEIIEAIHKNYEEFLVCCYERKEPDPADK